MTSTINKPLAAIALLSRFNWFDVSSEDTTGKTAHFCATGIYLDKFGFVWFQRQFATPTTIENSIIDVIAERDNRFLFIDRIGTVYTVEAKNKDIADCSTASGSKDDPASLIDWHRSGITEDGEMFVVLDLRKMGHISNVENSRIKYLMSAYLGGLSVSKHVCRTIYFCKEGDQIYVGLYNLETEKPMTKKLFDDGRYYVMYCGEDQINNMKVRQMMEDAKDKLGVVVPLF